MSREDFCTVYSKLHIDHFWIYSLCKQLLFANKCSMSTWKVLLLPPSYPQATSSSDPKLTTCTQGPLYDPVCVLCANTLLIIVLCMECQRIFIIFIFVCTDVWISIYKLLLLDNSSLCNLDYNCLRFCCGWIIKFFCDVEMLKPH